MAKIIELERLSKTFRGGLVAVDDVSLAVEDGEFLTILGPSGCGKTTTLRMIGGFEFPDAGSILLDGRDVTELPPYKRPINMMFQDFALFPHMSVAKNIGYGLMIGGMNRREIAPNVEEALRTIELLDKADSRPYELSIGQRQRVALARALVRRPRVLLLDEPLSALDARLRETMQLELKRLHEKIGLTFIMVTHDQSEALVMSDRIMVMDRGRVVQIGTPAGLYERPATPYVANFLGASNMISGKVVEIAGDCVTVGCGNISLRVVHDAASDGDGPIVGQPVTLSMRPEKIILSANGAALPTAANRLSGLVREHFFHGDSIRISVDIGTERLLVIHRQLDAGLDKAALPAIGSELAFAVNPESVNLFEQESEDAADISR